MLRFYAVKFTAVIADLELARGGLTMASLGAIDGHAPSSEAATMVRKTLDTLDKVLPGLPISSTVRQQAERTSNRLTVDMMNTDDGRSEAILLLGELKLNVVNDLRAHLFLVVPEDVRELWEQPAPAFGVAVADRFPDANPDIAAAARCLALDEWTAVVFHSMRVLEHGLRDLAQKVGHTFPTPVEYQQWETIIRNIEAAIQPIVAALPKGTAQKSDDAEFYHKAANQFWHFKDAWRNHVSHGRRTYDAREARQVYDSVKAFMLSLAGRP